MKIIRIGDGEGALPVAESAGSKAANLARMAALGLPVPPAFVLPVELCAAVNDGDRSARRKLADGLREGIDFPEQATGRRLDDERCPLLLSVRSIAAQSMPGMLETVLDVGCTAVAVRGLVRSTGNPHFAWDCRRRFLECYAGVVCGLKPALIADRRAAICAEEGAEAAAALDSEAMERLAGELDELCRSEKAQVPEPAREQLAEAALAVFRSWQSARARTYRRLQHLEHLPGTAVTVQAMVFGNRGASSGAGVAFSRDPSTGATEPVIDLLFEAQGEDIASGNRTPEGVATLERALPALADELRRILRLLEAEFGDVQDIEFTIEDGRLWVLQTRAAKRTPRAAMRFAIDLVAEGRLMPAEALRRLDGLDLKGLELQRLTGAGAPAASGLGASAGVAIGRAAFDSAAAERLAGSGDPVILFRPDTSTADVAGFAVSAGIVTAVGGRTAHAALVARQMGKPCIVGCAALAIERPGNRARLAGERLEEGDWVSVDGEAGTIHRGRGKILSDRPEAELAEIAAWRQQSAAQAGG